MKILYITTAYPEMVRQIDIDSQESFRTNEAKFYQRGFGWANFWQEPMAAKGVEFWQITANFQALQRQWAKEHLTQAKSEQISDAQIIVEQTLSFKPDILWIDHYDIKLLNLIKEKCSFIKLVATWTGSAIAPLSWLKEVDLTLSCAPEAVEALNNRGLNAKHLNHFFSPVILSQLDAQSNKPKHTATFIGQLLPTDEFHQKRLSFVVNLIPFGLKVYSPPWGLYTLKTYMMKKLKGDKNTIKTTDFLRYLANRKPGCFGVEMYSTLAKSLVTLNVHADSSPLYASNMRLYEATGVGTCLLTDWKQNMSDLFEDGKEVVTYNSLEDCKEKFQYLINNPEVASEIGKKGQIRCLRDHTIYNRIDVLLDIFSKNLS